MYKQKLKRYSQLSTSGKFFRDHPEKRNEYNRRTKLEDPIKYMMWRLRARANKKQIKFTITIDDIVKHNVCPCCRVKLKYNTFGCHKNNSASFDRVDNKKGYIPGNVSIICYRCNILKRDGSVNDFVKLIEYIEHHEQNK